MIEERFCIHSKSADDNVYDRVAGQYYSWETVVYLLNTIFKLIDKQMENDRIRARKCRNQGNVKKAIKFEESVLTLSVLKTAIKKELEYD